MRNLRFPLALASLILCVGGCTTLPVQLQPKLAGITPRIAGIDLEGVDLAFDVKVDNPYPWRIKTPRFNYALSIENQEFLQSTHSTSIDLPASGVGSATLPVRIGYTQLLNTVRSLGKANEASYALKGAFLLDLAGRSLEIPLSHSGKFPVLKLPKFQIVSMERPQISLSGAKLSLAVDVTNPNVFGIDIARLTYQASLGDIPLGGITASTKDAVAPGAKGRIDLQATLSSVSAATSLLQGNALGKIKLVPSGALKTPYGEVKLPNL